MPEAFLPREFADWEPYAPAWCLATEAERYARRLASSMAEMRAFYDAVFPRLDEAIDYCDRFPLDGMPDDARRLLQLVHSLVMVAMCVEIWRQPRAIDSADARLDRTCEPLLSGRPRFGSRAEMTNAADEISRSTVERTP